MKIGLSGIITLLIFFILTGMNISDVSAAKKGKKKQAVKEKQAGPASQKETFWAHPNGNLLSASFASDGKSAVSVNSEGDIFFWDVESGKKIRTVRFGTRAISAAFFGNTKIALAGGLDKNNAILMQNLTTGEKIETLAGHKGGITTLAFSTDGDNILSGGWNHQVTLWGGTHGDIVRVFKGHNAVVHSVAVSPNRVLVASGSADGTIKIWNMSTGELTQTIKKAHKKGVLKVSFSPNGKLILSGGIEKGKDKKNKKDIYSIKLWDLETGKSLFKKTNFSEDQEELVIAMFSPNGKYVLSGNKSGTSTPNATLKLWDATAPEIIPAKGAIVPPKEPLRIFSGHGGGISTVTFSPDSTRILAGGDGTLTIWETETGKILGGGVANDATLPTGVPPVPSQG